MDSVRICFNTGKGQSLRELFLGSPAACIVRDCLLAMFDKGKKQTSSSCIQGDSCCLTSDTHLNTTHGSRVQVTATHQGPHNIVLYRHQDQLKNNTPDLQPSSMHDTFQLNASRTPHLCEERQLQDWGKP